MMRFTLLERLKIMLIVVGAIAGGRLSLTQDCLFLVVGCGVTGF
jgi:hypothetical protein